MSSEASFGSFSSTEPQQGSRASSCAIQLSDADTAPEVTQNHNVESEISDIRTRIEGDKLLDIGKHHEEGLEYGLNLPREPSKDEQINEIVSALDRTQAINVYPARKPLPSGENATWDISNGEERTQPRRPSQRRPYQRRQRWHAQRSSSSSSIRSIRTGSKNSIPASSSHSNQQMPRMTEDNPDLHQGNQQVGLQSDLTSLVTLTTWNAFEDSLLYNRQNNSSGISEVDTRIDSYSDMHHVPFFTTSAATYQPPRALVERPIRDLSTDIPDISPYARGSQFADELAHGIWRKFTLPYNHTMTNSSGSIQFTPSTSLSSSTPPLRNNESSASRGSGSFLSPVETSDTVPGVDNRVIFVQAQKERSNDNLDWFKDFIHDHMLEPSSE